MPIARFIGVAITAVVIGNSVPALAQQAARNPRPCRRRKGHNFLIAD